MERVESVEMLDRGNWSEEQVACALGAIRRANLLNGGDRMHKWLFRRVVSELHPARLDVLEVASARGEVIRATARSLRKEGISTRITLMDRSSQHLPDPDTWAPDLGGPTLLAGDAISIPLENESVDIVSCCLFLHHLNAEQGRLYLREALRVSRVAVLINDVERTRMNYFLSLLYRLIDPSELSRHDGPTSVRQAYTCAELNKMLRETGYRFEVRRSYLYRLGAIVWKNAVNCTGS